MVSIQTGHLFLVVSLKGQCWGHYYLLLVYVNYLPSNVTSPMLMFADDTKIIRSILNDTSIDCIQLQSDINNLLEWSRINGN